MAFGAAVRCRSVLAWGSTDRVCGPVWPSLLFPPEGVDSMLAKTLPLRRGCFGSACEHGREAPLADVSAVFVAAICSSWAGFSPPLRATRAGDGGRRRACAAVATGPWTPAVRQGRGRLLPPLPITRSCPRRSFSCGGLVGALGEGLHLCKVHAAVRGRRSVWRAARPSAPGRSVGLPSRTAPARTRRS